VKKLWVVLAVLFLSVLGGGTAFAGTEQTIIRADFGWQEASNISINGVYIPQGQRVWISPSGQWSNGSKLEVGPQGYTASQSKGFMPYCKYTQSLPFGRLIAMTWRSNTNYTLYDAGVRGYIPGPGWLYFRINERDGQCLDNNSGQSVVDMTAPFIK
jgi:hypothetical protein